MNLQIEINKRDRLLSKISELRGMLSNGVITRKSDASFAVNKALSYIDECQTLNMLIAQAMYKSGVEIGDSNVPLAVAAELLTSLESKISVLDALIESKLTDDVIDVIDNRNKFCKERDNISDIITMTAWRTELETSKTSDEEE